MGLTMFGGYATKVVVPHYQVCKLPSKMDLKEGGGFLCTAVTAWYALFQQYSPKEGDTILIHSVAGGVGSMLAQLGKLAKLRVVGVIGSSSKLEYCKMHLGCDLVIDKSVENLWEVAEKFSPSGYDAVFDANGYTTLQQGYDHLAPGGRLVSYGFHSMLPRGVGFFNLAAWAKVAYGYLNTPKFSPMDMVNKNKAVLCFNLSFMFNKKELIKEAMESLRKEVENGNLKVSAVEVFPMSKAGEAHALLETGKTVGKLVLDTQN